MKNKLFYIFFLLLFSCKKEPNIKLMVVNNQEIKMNQNVSLQLVNESQENVMLFINNKINLYPTNSYSIYYKLYDDDFKEIKKDTIMFIDMFIDDEFSLSDEYDLFIKKQQDSLKSYKGIHLQSSDSLRLTYRLKNKFYTMLNEFLEYRFEKNKKYYISFFYQGYANELNLEKDSKTTEIIQSEFYLLK